MIKSRIILRVFFIVALIFILAWISARAEQQGDFSYSLQGNEATITGYTGLDQVVTLPSVVGDSGQYPVVAVGDHAFADLNTITRVIIPNSVITVGSNAWQNGHPDLVIECVDWNVSVMEYALANGIDCQADNIFISKTGQLNAVPGKNYDGTADPLTIPQGVIKIGDNEVFSQGSFTQVALPTTLTQIGYKAFYQSDLESVNLPDNVTSVASQAFGSCPSLTSFNIPAAVSSWGNGVWGGSQALTNITVAGGNPNLSAANGMLFNKNQTILYEYPAVTGIFTPPAGVTAIRANCFYQNPGITGFVSNEVSTIEDEAFHSCSNLESVYLSPQLGSLGRSLFNSSTLTDLIIANDSINIDPTAFDGAGNIQNVWCNAGSNAASYDDDKASRPIEITDAPTDSRLKIGETVTLGWTEAADFTALNTYQPSSVAWSSSDEAVATVEASTGLVTAVSTGTVQISAAREDGLKAVVGLQIENPVIIAGITPDTGYSDSDFVTNATEFMVVGETLPGAVVELYAAGSANNPAIVATADENGIFALSVDATTDFGGIENMITSFTAQTTIAETGYSSNPIAVTVDTITPSYQVSPQFGASDVELYTTVVLTFDEAVRLHNPSQDLSTEYLNTTGQTSDPDDDVFDIDLYQPGGFGYVKIKDIAASYLADDNRMTFNITPKNGPFFPRGNYNSKYRFNITQVEDDAGNIRGGFTDFTVTDVNDITLVQVEVITSLTGMASEVTNNEVHLAFPEFDLAQTEIIDELKTLKGNYDTYQNTLIAGGGDYSQYAGVILRVWADAEYQNFYLGESFYAREWNRTGSISGTVDGKSYVDICVRVAYDDGESWQKTSESSAAANRNEYTIVFEKNNGTVVSTERFVLTMAHDLAAPAGYQVAFDQPHVNLDNQEAVSFALSNAEENTTIHYTIRDNDDTTPDVTGEQAVGSSEITVDNLDLSSLADGWLYFDISLKDAAGNMGGSIKPTIMKDTSSPTVVISTEAGSPVFTKTIPVNVEFSESVSGFDIDDITVSSGYVSYLDGSDESYYIEVTPEEVTHIALLTVDIAENVCVDSRGNPNLAASQLAINYMTNEQPRVIKDIDDILDAQVDETLTFDLAEHFTDDDGDELVYQVCSSAEFEVMSKGGSCEDIIGELNGTIWSCTLDEDDLNITYTVKFSVTDNKSEPAMITFSLRAPGTIDFNLKKTNVTTYNGSDGTITIEVVDGESFYQYSKDGGKTWQSTNVFTDLLAGEYQIKVRDEYNTFIESEIHSVTITHPDKPSSSSGSSPQPKEKHQVELALEKASKNEQGIISAKVEQREQNYQGHYSQNIPNSYFSGEQKVLEIATPVANVSVPSNMFTEKVSGRIDFTVKEVDKQELSPEVRALIGDKKIIDVNLQINRKQQKWSSKDVEIEIAIPYTPTAAESENTDSIIAYYLSPEEEIIPITLSEYDLERGAVVFKTSHFSKYGIMVIDKMFTDIANYQWAHKAITSMTARGVIKGSSPNTFSPEATATRADMVIFVNRFFGITGEAGESFNDVVAGKYYYNEIAAAQQAGILVGIAAEAFQPEEPISRQDMMVLIKNALDYAGMTGKLTMVSGKTLSDFDDSYLVADYAREEVDYLIHRTIVGGYNNRISPKQHTTRADVIAILYKLLLALQS